MLILIYDQGQPLLRERDCIRWDEKRYHSYTDTEMRNILGRSFYLWGVMTYLQECIGKFLRRRKSEIVASKAIVIRSYYPNLRRTDQSIWYWIKGNCRGGDLWNCGNCSHRVSHDIRSVRLLWQNPLELRHEGIREYKGKFDYPGESLRVRQAR